MKSVIIQLILLSLYYLTYGQKIICNNESKESLDYNIARLYVYGDEKRLYPTSQEELKKFCRESIRLYDWIKDYSNKCLEKLSKQVVVLMMYSLNKHNVNICKSRRRAVEFIYSATCGNVAKNETHKCWNNWINEMDGIKKYENIKLRIPLFCCTFYQYKACNERSYERNSKSCDQKAIEGQDKLLNSYAAETMGLLCGDWPEDSDKCEKIIEFVPKSKEKKLAKSPIKAFVEMLDSIPE